MSRLPRFLKVKADVSAGEINDKTGTLFELLNILFDEVRTRSVHYERAVVELEALQKEMDPNDTTTDFAKLVGDINLAVGQIFPQSSITVNTDLTKPDTLKPKYDILVKSNVTTSLELQGTGLVRSAVVALLRFNQQRKLRNADETHLGLIIGFEEPELFLHPNAAESMRELIYELSTSDCQIIATTHSPYMIDLSKNSTQLLNSYAVVEHSFSAITSFNITEAYLKIEVNQKAHVKMLQKIDDYVSRVFFARKVVVVEGDTEDIVFKKTISLMPEYVKKQIQSDYQIIMAHGKATMISFVRYLKALHVDVFVVHDEDAETEGAEIMNIPILQALEGDSTKRYMMHNCIEDVLGYSVPKSDKPFKAYQYVSVWKTWNDVPDAWKDIMRIVFAEYSNQL